MKLISKLYEKSKLWFALACIIVYVVGTSITDELSRQIGIEKIITVPYLLILSIFALAWMRKNGLFEMFGLCKTDVDAKRFLYYIPLVALVSCNFWFGVKMNGTLGAFALYTISMLCVGFIEELIFRGFLFRAMEKDGIKSAIIVSSVTFGIGHIVNLFNGSGATLIPNLCQVISAIAIGFLFVVMFYRGKSLIPCILAHQFINVTSFFANEEAINNPIRIAQSAVLCVIALAYACALLKALPKACVRIELHDNEWEFDGVTHDRQIVRAIVFDDDGYFYFVRVDRDDDFGKATCIETAGGGVEDGENLEIAIHRELSEELGASIDVICKIGVVSDYYNLIHRHNINNYYLCKVNSFGETHMTEDEINSFHLSKLKMTYDEAVAEYKKRRETPLGRLICNRELPILKRAKEILDDK